MPEFDVQVLVRFGCSDELIIWRDGDGADNSLPCIERTEERPLSNIPENDAAKVLPRR
jgi:hypothetical protein